MRRLVVVVGFGLVAVAAGLWVTCRGASRSSAPPTIAAKPRPMSGLAPEPVEPPPTGTLRLEGQVIDEQDRPVAGARVMLLRHGVTTTSGDDGTFVFEHLGAAWYTLAAAKGEDTYSSSPRIDLAEESEPVTIRLRAASTLSVHVVDAETYAPVAGAIISHRGHPGALEPVTDALGVAELHGISPEGVVALTVSAEGHATLDIERELAREVATREELRVELARGVPVGGTVVAPSGEPVPGATVIIDGAQVYVRLTADAHGAWQAPGLGAGPHRFRATGDGFRPAPMLELELDGVHPRGDIAIAVVARPRITGVVVDGANRPVAGAQIANGDWNSARSDAYGRFTLWCDPGDTTAIVHATEGPRISEDLTVTLDNAPAVRLVLVVSTIAGVVVDAHGKPVPRARIDVDGGDEHRHRRDDVADGTGHFELGGIAPGPHRLAAEHGDQAWSPATRWVTTTTGDRDVKLVVPDLGQLTGRVVLDGHPVTRFHYEVFQSDEPIGDDRLARGSDGRFTTSGLPTGEWRLLVYGPGFARKMITGIAIPGGGERDLGDIVVDHGAVLRGRVSDGRGAPIAGAKVTFHVGPLYNVDRMNDGVDAVTDVAGAYRLDGITPPIGGAHIVARHPTLGTSDERIVADRDTSIDLVIAPGGSIDGRLTGGSSGDYFIRATSIRDASVDVEARFDNIGGFHFDNVPAGEYVLGLPYSPVWPVHVVVVAGQRAKVVLTYPKVTVALSVHGASCKTVRLELASTRDLLESQDCRDAVTFVVAPGAYQLCADDSCRPVTVAAAPEDQRFTFRQ